MLFWNLRCDNYSRETTIQGRKLLISKTFLVRQLFKGDNYSREETIRGNTVSSIGVGSDVKGEDTIGSIQALQHWKQPDDVCTGALKKSQQ